MQIFPAIDLRHGQAVRLFQGDYDQMTVFSHSPADVAKSFADQGATNLHCVDLDGAKDGQPVNSEVIARLLQQGLYTQVGGGIRDHARVDYYLSLGVGRVILGTAALENFPFVEEMVKLYVERDLVVAAARGVKPLAVVADPLCQLALDEGVNVLCLHVDRESAALDIRENTPQSLYNILNALLGDDAALAEHGRVSDAALYVLAEHTAVKRDRAVEIICCF